MPNAFVEKLRGYGSLDHADETLLESSCRSARVHPAGHDLIRDGDEPGPVFVVLRGWACRYKILPGGSRQIIAFLMPGDFCNVQAAPLKKMDHSIGTLTAAKIVTISRARMDGLIEQRPGLAQAFRWTQMIDEGALRETIVSMGRRKSIERVAHLLCELCLRMRDIGIATEDGCMLPITQIMLADAVGMTPVHLNRVVQKLRLAGALAIEGKSLVITDVARLALIAGFNDDHLRQRLKHSA